MRRGTKMGPRTCLLGSSMAQQLGCSILGSCRGPLQYSERKADPLDIPKARAGSGGPYAGWGVACA